MAVLQQNSPITGKMRSYSSNNTL